MPAIIIPPTGYKNSFSSVGSIINHFIAIFKPAQAIIKPIAPVINLATKNLKAPEFYATQPTQDIA